MLAAGALLAGVLSACTGGGGDGGVRLGRVERADVSEVVEAPATVSARATAVLRSPAEGTIARLYVADGDPVDEGDVLAKISSPGAREQLALALEADRSASAGGGVPEGLDLSEFQRRTDRTARDGFAAARKIALRIPDLKERALVLARHHQGGGPVPDGGGRGPHRGGPAERRARQRGRDDLVHHGGAAGADAGGGADRPAHGGRPDDQGALRRDRRARRPGGRRARPR
ncbi:biotin/lipoyl-binding protein [Actinomadura madurae]|uniref:biotin/lipoyl-binding protein n=1 Tax=Actinomadura madurae TaxID=1993 RepID=UPI0020D23E72|nr:biotin/lipoyl-binding protein [Actinomadura madurae]MCP9952801.1 biotin/lipoyl-binding protein [Actinomadura madurae]